MSGAIAAVDGVDVIGEIEARSSGGRTRLVGECSGSSSIEVTGPPFLLGTAKIEHESPTAAYTSVRPSMTAMRESTKHRMQWRSGRSLSIRPRRLQRLRHSERVISGPSVFTPLVAFTPPAA